MNPIVEAHTVEKLFEAPGAQIYTIKSWSVLFPEQGTTYHLAIAWDGPRRQYIEVGANVAARRHEDLTQSQAKAIVDQLGLSIGNAPKAPVIGGILYGREGQSQPHETAMPAHFDVVNHRLLVYCRDSEIPFLTGQFRSEDGQTTHGQEFSLWKRIRGSNWWQLSSTNIGGLSQ